MIKNGKHFYLAVNEFLRIYQDTFARCWADKLSTSGIKVLNSTATIDKIEQRWSQLEKFHNTLKNCDRSNSFSELPIVADLSASETTPVHVIYFHPFAGFFTPCPEGSNLWAGIAFDPESAKLVTKQAHSSGAVKGFVKKYWKR